MSIEHLGLRSPLQSMNLLVRAHPRIMLAGQESERQILLKVLSDQVHIRGCNPGTRPFEFVSICLPPESRRVRETETCVALTLSN